MFGAYVGDDAYIWADDALQGCHLVGQRDSGLEDGHRGVGVEFPYREGHSDLGVVASGRSDDRVVRRQQLIEPLLDGGLAARTGDAHHRDAEPAAVGAGEVLEGPGDARHEQDYGIGRIGHIVGNVAGHEVAHSAVVELTHIAVPVVVAGADGEEQRLCGIGQRTAVGQ